MDFGQLAGSIVSILNPYLGVLVEAGASTLGKEGVKTIWSKLVPHLSKNTELKTAVDDVVKDPKDEDSVAALRKAVKKLLERDPELAQSLQSVCQTITSGRDVYVSNTIENSPNAQIGPSERRD